MDEEIDDETILTFDDYVTRYGAIDATTDPHVVAVRIVDEDMENQSPEQKMNETQRAVAIAEYERLVPLYIKFSAENQQAQPQPQPQAVRELFHDLDPGPEWFGSSLKLAFPKSVDGAGAALASHPGFLDTGAALASHPGFLDTGAALASHPGFLDTGFGAALTSGLNPREATEQFTQILKSCELNDRDKAYDEFMKLLKLKLIDGQHPLNQKMMDVFEQFMTIWTFDLKKLLYTIKTDKFTPTPDETKNYKNALLCTAQSFFQKREAASTLHRRMTTRVGIFNHDILESLLSRTKTRQMFQVVTKSDTASLLTLGSSSEKFVELETASVRSATGRRIDYFQAENFKKLPNVKIVVPSDQSRMSTVVSDLFTSKPGKIPDVITIPKELTEDPVCVQLIGNKVFHLKNLDEILEQTEHFEYMLQVEELTSGSDKRERIKCIVMALELLDESKDIMLHNIESAKRVQSRKTDIGKSLNDKMMLTDDLQPKTGRTESVIADITREYDVVFECHSKVKSYLTEPEPELDQAKASLECTQRAAKALKDKIKSNTTFVDSNKKAASRVLLLHDKIVEMETSILKSKPVSDLLGVKCTLYTLDDAKIRRENTLHACEFFKSVVRECAFFTTSAPKLVDDAEKQIETFEEAQRKIVAAEKKALAAEKKALAAKKKALAPIQAADDPVQAADDLVQAASNAPIQAADAANAPIQAADDLVQAASKVPVKASKVPVKASKVSVQAAPVSVQAQAAEAPVSVQAADDPVVKVLIVDMHTLKKNIKADLKTCQEFSIKATEAVSVDEAKHFSVEARQACDSVVTQTTQYITMIHSRFSLDKTFSSDAAAAQAAAEKNAEAAQAAAQAAEAAELQRKQEEEAFAKILAATNVAKQKRLQNEVERDAAIERKRIQDQANAADDMERKRIENEANAAAVAVEFKKLFTCDFQTMFAVAEKIKHLPDDVILHFFQSNPHLIKYMMFNETFTRTFLVVGILQKYLKQPTQLFVTGKTALQLTAVFNDVTIERSPRSPQVVSDLLIAPRVCISRPCSDFDISLVSTVAATRPLKQAFLDTFLLFFDTAAGSLQNFDSHHHDEYDDIFLRTPNTFLTVRTVNADNTMTVKKSLGGVGGVAKLDVLDVKFLTVEENGLVFPGFNPVSISFDTRSGFLQGIMPPELSILEFSFPDLPSFLHESVQIIINELTKLLANKDMSKIENYFFTMTTLLKFFSRALQLSYIISGKGGGGTSTRVVFDREVAVFTPDQEMNDIIIAILQLFLMNDYTLNPETFYEFAIYKETRKTNWKSREKMSLHEKIIEILTRFNFNLPPPDRMGGKKNKLKTKRKAMKSRKESKAMKSMKESKAMKTRKTRKTRKTNKSKQNNKKKRFTRNISPYKLTNKNRGRKTRKY
jgi:hypothetical protein